MTFLSELDVVNDMLAIIGETPLNSLEEDHDLTASCLTALKNAGYREQAKGWWFNQEIMTLTPDAATGFINLPGDIIRIDPTDTMLQYVARGRRLYKPYAMATENRYVFYRSVKCHLLRLVPFDELPASAQLFVAASAKLSFQRNYDADQMKMRSLNDEYRDALITLNSEHIRNRNVNLIRRPSTVGLLNQIGIHANPAGLPIA